MIRRLVRFVDSRSGTAPFLRKTLRYLFPDHWSFLLGEVALYAFVVLVATGNFSGPVGPSWWGVRSGKAQSS